MNGFIFDIDGKLNDEKASEWNPRRQIQEASNLSHITWIQGHFCDPTSEWIGEMSSRSSKGSLFFEGWYACLAIWLFSSVSDKFLVKILAFVGTDDPFCFATNPSFVISARFAFLESQFQVHVRIYDCPYSWRSIKHHFVSVSPLSSAMRGKLCYGCVIRWCNASSFGGKVIIF